MSPEAWFKVGFAAAFVFAVAVAAAAVKRAARVHGSGVNQLDHEVQWLPIARALLGIVFYAALGAWFVDARWFARTRLPLPASARWTALAALVPLLTFYAWSFRSLGSNYRGGVGLHERHELVTTGAYRWMRHPIYAAFIGIMADVLVLSASWLLGGAGLLLVGTIAAGRIRIEEQQLYERFGLAWMDYRGRTQRT